MESYALEAVDEAVAEIQTRKEASLLSLKGVVGVGVGRKVVAGLDTDEPCLVVLVSEKLRNEELAEGARIPARIEHCKTDVIEVGAIAASEARPRATDTDTDTGARTPSSTAPLGRRARPARGGFGVSRVGGLTGTIAAGAVEADAPPGVIARYFLLSSNLALADLNQGTAGDPILQPSSADGGSYPQDLFGRLSRFVPLRFDGQANQVDAAVAEVTFGDLDSGVFWIGATQGRAPSVRIGHPMQKTGHSSCYSTGLVRAVNVTVDVSYGAARARFERQILVSAMATLGDSGSLVLDSVRRPVGLVLATSPRCTLVSPIGLVEALLGIRLSG